MKFFRHSSEGPPCAHMERFLQMAADGSARGLVRWYAWAHAIRCQRCMRFLESIQKMIHALRAARAEEPSKDALDRLNAALSGISAS
jgi:hypothetical protein